jgi:hypothetical protein
MWTLQDIAALCSVCCVALTVVVIVQLVRLSWRQAPVPGALAGSLHQPATDVVAHVANTAPRVTAWEPRPQLADGSRQRRLGPR